MFSYIRLSFALLAMLGSTLALGGEDSRGKDDVFKKTKETEKLSPSNPEGGRSEDSASVDLTKVHYKIKIPINITCRIKINESLGTALKYGSEIELYPNITEEITASINITSLEGKLFDEEIINFQPLEKIIPETGFYPVDISNKTLEDKIKLFSFLNSTSNTSFIENYNDAITNAASYIVSKATLPIAAYLPCYLITTTSFSSRDFCLTFASLLAITESAVLDHDYPWDIKQVWWWVFAGSIAATGLVEIFYKQAEELKLTKTQGFFVQPMFVILKIALVNTATSAVTSWFVKRYGNFSDSFVPYVPRYNCRIEKLYSIGTALAIESLVESITKIASGDSSDNFLLSLFLKSISVFLVTGVSDEYCEKCDHLPQPIIAALATIIHSIGYYLDQDNIIATPAFFIAYASMPDRENSIKNMGLGVAQGLATMLSAQFAICTANCIFNSQVGSSGILYKAGAAVVSLLVIGLINGVANWFEYDYTLEQSIENATSTNKLIVSDPILYLQKLVEYGPPDKSSEIEENSTNSTFPWCSLFR